MNSAQQTTFTALKAAQEPQGVRFSDGSLNKDGSLYITATPPTGGGLVQLNISVDGKLTNRGWLVSPNSR